MTGEYSLIAPAMLATMVAYLVTGDTSIYESQVPTRLDSPAHKQDYVLPLLQSLSVADAMTPVSDGALLIASPDTPSDTVGREMRARKVSSVPIVEGGKLVGLVTATDLARVAPGEAALIRAGQLMTRVLVRAYPDEPLYAAWVRMARRGWEQLPVAERGAPARLLGLVTAEAVGEVLRPGGARAAARGPGPAATTVSAKGGRETAGSRNGDPLGRARVADVMLARPRLVRERQSAGDARRLLDERGAALMVVDDAGNLTGIVTRSDLRGREDRVDGRELTVGEVAVRNLVTVGPNDTLALAVRRMNRLGLRQLPVVPGALPARPLGLLRRSDVLAAYGADGETPSLADDRAMAVDG